MSEDLWPKDLLSDIPRIPAEMLNEQAEALGNRTSNVVQARVDTEGEGNSRRFGGEPMWTLRFVLFSPALDDYEYELFSVSHSGELYPIRVHGADEGELESEEQFASYLRAVFAEERTLRVVRAMIAQARAIGSAQTETIRRKAVGALAARAPAPVAATRRSRRPEPESTDDDDIPF